MWSSNPSGVQEFPSPYPFRPALGPLPFNYLKEHQFEQHSTCAEHSIRGYATINHPPAEYNRQVNVYTSTKHTNLT